MRYQLIDLDNGLALNWHQALQIFGNVSMANKMKLGNIIVWHRKGKSHEKMLVEVLVLIMTHIPIQVIGNYNTLWFWYMVPEPHGCLYIEIYFLIILFQVTIYFKYVHDYFNVHLRCCVLCHYYMFYGRLRFYCILIVYAKFFMFTLFFTVPCQKWQQ